jgi:ribose-phosphate pyrophosphokinase
MVERNYLKMKILDGGSNPVLTDEICRYLGIEPANAVRKNFMDGEYYIRIEESVRGAHVFIIHPTSNPVNDNLMKLLITIDALKRASAAKITVVMPYYGYSRQEKKTQGREPITAKLVANLLETAGANRIITLDLHEPAIQGFFDFPTDHVSAIPIFGEYFLNKEFEGKITVVSPDAGGALRARNLGRILLADLAIVDKRRPKPNMSVVMNIVGDVRGKTAIIVDDIIDTGGSMVKAAQAVLDAGAKEVYAACTHPVFSGEAIEKIQNSCIKELVVTNTILHSEKLEGTKIKILTIAPLLGEIIRRVYLQQSVSELFN